ncbi:MAG: right-handed parallel beta-helix repeat-containing protein [Desulfurococcaceae archaeon]
MNNSSRVKRAIFALITICALISPFLAPPAVLAGGKRIVVPTDYPDIQTALDHANDGDVIAVLSGTYSGFEVKKSVAIIGENDETVVVKGPIRVYANDVKISTMHIVLQDYTEKNPAALWTQANNTVLVGVNIESAGNGILIGNASFRASISVERSRILAGLNYDHSSGVTAYLCSSLSVYYSNITLIKGNLGINSCKQLQIMHSTIVTPGTGISIGMFADQVEISGNTIRASDTGIHVGASGGVFSSNVIASNGTGIYMERVRGNTIANNTIHGSGIGIQANGDNNLIVGNYITSGGPAIELRGSGNVITNNTLAGSRGINGLVAYGNIIAFNFINQTGSIGIYLSKQSTDNVVFGNTFWLCYNYNAADESGKNQWYVENETLKMGNYWYDHIEPDKDNDGIVDVPYVIATTLDVQILDKYPLTKPVHPITYVTTTTAYTTSYTPTQTTSFITTTQIPTTTQLTTPETTTQETSIPVEEGSSLVMISVAVVILLLILGVAVFLVRKRS